MIYIAADHQGREALDRVLAVLESLSLEVQVLGKELWSAEDDYPDFAKLVCEKVLETGEFGILICGSGQGAVIASNRYKGIRAGLCWDANSAKLGRSDDNINVLCLPKEPVGSYVEIIEGFLNTELKPDDKYARRIEKLDVLT